MEETRIEVTIAESGKKLYRPQIKRKNILGFSYWTTIYKSHWYYETKDLAEHLVEKYLRELKDKNVIKVGYI